MRLPVLWAVLRKETAAGWASPRFRLSGLLILLLSAVVSLSAAREHESRRDLWQILEEQNGKSLGEARTYSSLRPVALRAPQPLALFAQGFDARLGREVTISPFAVPRQLSGDYRGNDFAVHRVELDLTTIVVVVLGFTALLLSFDAFTQERERRTDKHLALAGVAPTELLLGKYLGLFLLLNVPLALAVGSSVAFFVRKDLLLLDATTLPRLIGLTASYELYLSLLVLLGLTTSLVSATGSRALSRLLFVWLVFFLGFPHVALNLGRDSEEQRQAERAVEQRVAAWEAEAQAELEREEKLEPLLASFSGHRSVFQEPDPEDWHVRYIRYGSAAFYDALVGHVQKELARGRQAAERYFRAWEETTALRRARERRAMRAALLSPGYALERVAESLAGTAADDHDRFLDACRTYRTTLLDHLEAKGALRSWRWFTDDSPETLRPWPGFFGWAPGDVTPENVSTAIKRFSSPAVDARVQAHMDLAREDPDRRLPVTDLPRFSYADPGWRVAVRRAAPELAWILALHLGLLALAAWWIRSGRAQWAATTARARR